ncbi:transporter [Streptomyces camponoticapitis]|uniref:Transporter n=1 Tax=Streptomyces camponoticapitis TaxID=1616125 RepID=A0ABQ2ES00_9ACTN|nr:hypothetical protein [Streptomyces camponoticapitis]GGK19132.1 transporter [Streptomyces camponoticapitis]
MSTLLEERPPAPKTTAARPGLRGPLRVSVRQHRVALLIGAGALLAGVLVLVALRIWAGSVADDFAATGCTLSGPDRRECFPTSRAFSDDMLFFDQVVTYGSYALQFLPAVIGAFVAGPMVARELESGTYKLAWTQSVGPARWLASKLLPPAAAVLLLVPVLTAVRAWATSSVPDSSPYPPTPWYEPTTFVSLGTAPAAYALLGIAAGALVGLLVARTVPAMSVAVLALGGVFLAMNQVRDRLWPTATATESLGGYPSIGGSWWWVDDGLVTTDGDHVSGMDCVDALQEEPRCLADLGAMGRYVDHHPGSHFWPIQLVETGIVLALTAACVLAAFTVLRRRHG